MECIDERKEDEHSAKNGAPFDPLRDGYWHATESGRKWMDGQEKPMVHQSLPKIWEMMIDLQTLKKCMNTIGNVLGSHSREFYHVSINHSIIPLEIVDLSQL